jgi:hypothetical protein
MPEQSMKDGLVIRDLGDGLILRHAERADAEALAQFDAYIFRNSETAPLNPRVIAGVYDAATRPHPTFRVSDFIIVEDTRIKHIVSSCNLISQTWCYEGIPFGVGRPEVVTTNPDYRKRGLVRTQFEVLHQWSADRGELVQGITGIPFFYRQFGYEMAMPLGGGRVGLAIDIPFLKEGDREPYQVRPARVDDLPFVNQLYQLGSKRSLVYCIRSSEQWRYELHGASPNNFNRLELWIIESNEGVSLGCLAHSPNSSNGRLDLQLYELSPGVSWLQVTPSVLRYIKTTGEAPGLETPRVAFRQFGLNLGSDHPAYHVIPSRLTITEPPYAWYLRVPDLSGFIRHISPVLEQRIAASIARGYTGDLKISFYRSGLSLRLVRGKLAQVEPWQPGTGDWANPRFPYLTFLKLVFGQCTISELTNVFTDCSGGNDETLLLLRSLFPQKASNVWPI